MEYNFHYAYIHIIQMFFDEDIAQWEIHLPSTHRDLGSIPSTIFI